MIINTDRLVKIESCPPKNLISWLRHHDSMTEKLKTYFGHTDLSVLDQSWCLPSWWDKFTLGVSCETVFHRKILMLTQKSPCWYAQTIVPEQSYKANTAFFDRLSHESLGVIVFNDPMIKRLALLNYAIDERCVEYHWLPKSIIDNNKQFWVRLSVFTRAKDLPFYLVEILLPSLIRMLNEME